MLSDRRIAVDKETEEKGADMAVQENRQNLERAELITSPPTVYREVPLIDYSQLDMLEQMQAHLSQLEDLHGRLRFVLTEVRSVLPRR